MMFFETVRDLVFAIVPSDIEVPLPCLVAGALMAAHWIWEYRRR